MYRFVYTDLNNTRIKCYKVLNFLRTTSARVAPSLSPWRPISLVFFANGWASGSISSRSSVMRPWIHSTQILFNHHISQWREHPLIQNNIHKIMHPSFSHLKRCKKQVWRSFQKRSNTSTARCYNKILRLHQPITQMNFHWQENISGACGFIQVVKDPHPNLKNLGLRQAANAA